MLLRSEHRHSHDSRMEKEKRRKKRMLKDKANVTAVKEESSVVASTEKEM